MGINNISATIGGNAIKPLDGSFGFSGKIDERDRCSFKFDDPTASLHFVKGTRVIVHDDIQGDFFTGVVDKDDEEVQSPSSRVRHTIDCVDNQFDADRRVSRVRYGTPQYAGVIAADQARRYLEPEGITPNYALDIDSSQSDFAAGTLTNVVSTSNVDDGDLELAPAGSDVTFSFPEFAGTSYNALKLVGKAAAGYTNAYVYIRIATPALAVVNGDTLKYSIWIPSTAKKAMAGVDCIFSDGTTMRDSSTSVVSTDNEDLASHPKTDLSDYVNQWYDRTFTFKTSKTVSYILLAIEGDDAGDYSAYFRNIRIDQISGPGYTAFNDGSVAPAENTLVSRSGYSNVSLTVATVYDKIRQLVITSPTITGVGLIKNSFLTWATSQIDNINIVTETTLDDQATWQEATLNAAIPNLLPGMKPGAGGAPNSGIRVRQTITNNSPNPEALVPFGPVRGLITSAASASKSDVFKRFLTGSEFSTGATLTNAKAPASGSVGASLNGYAEDYGIATANAGVGYTLWSTDSPFQRVHADTYQLQTNANSEVRAQMVAAGQYSDFISEFDIFVNASTSIQESFVYRTTNWQNNNNSFGYCVNLINNLLQFGKGTNNASGAGTFTQLTTAALSLTGGSWHRLRLEIIGSSHKIYLDGSLLITFTDSTYTAAGYVGFRLNNSTGAAAAAFFDNFGIVSALSGTWVSPSVSISGAANYGGSMIEWDEGVFPNDDVANGSSVLVETSVDNAATWQPATNGGAIAGLTLGQSLASKSVKIRTTFNTSNANVVPYVQGLTLWVLGQYSASGSRISPALALDNADRAGATLVSWNANQPAGTNVTVETTLDNGTSYQPATNGGAISGIASQSQVVDSFASDSHTSYTNTNRSGGSAATTTWDTSNSRLTMVGGSGALALLNAISAKDIDVQGILTRSDNGGLIWRSADTSNFYELAVRDSLASSNPNSIQLYKVVANTRTAIGSAIAISFLRDTPHLIRVTMTGTAIVVYFDGEQVYSATDASLTAAGKTGLRNDGGSSYVANFRALALGDDLTGKSVKTRTTLTSTNPAVSSQLLDLTIAALSPDIGLGALLPDADYANKYVSANIADAADQSDYQHRFSPDRRLIMQARMATPAPFVLTSDDVLIDGISVSNGGDTYRNRMILFNVVDSADFADSKTGDGETRSWSISYTLTQAPTILLNGEAQTVGVKGIDTGKQFYWEPGTPTISQDESGTILQKDIDVLDISGVGDFTTEVQRDNTGSFPGTVSQAQFALITGGTTGLVEIVEDAKGMRREAAETYGDSQLQKFGRIGRTVHFRTLHDGLGAGQALATFLPQHGISDADLLVASIDIAPFTTSEGNQKYWYTGEATEEAASGSWAKLMSNAFTNS